MAATRVIQGNWFDLTIDLQLVTFTAYPGGTVNKVSADFIPTHPVTAVLSDGARRYVYKDLVAVGNRLTITDVGMIHTGTYNLELFTKSDDGKPLRYKGIAKLIVADATDLGRIGKGIEFAIEHVVLDAATFVSIKGEPGDTPYIGSNGNWWVGDHDTGVRPDVMGQETDPSVPAHVKAITQEDIDKWNEGSEGYDVTYANGNLIFGSNGKQPTYSNGNLIL